jgi:hypothetical protein
LRAPVVARERLGPLLTRRAAIRLLLGAYDTPCNGEAAETEIRIRAATPADEIRPAGAAGSEGPPAHPHAGARCEARAQATEGAHPRAGADDATSQSMAWRSFRAFSASAGAVSTAIARTAPAETVEETRPVRCSYRW